jgi:imidazolonepropionase-like amidohydrolase
MRTFKFIIALLLLFHGSGQAQETFPVNGVNDHSHTLYAFTHANIVLRYNQTLSNATLLVQDNRIVDVGTQVSIPSNAVVTDLKGKYIYPAFIDAFSHYGINEAKREKRENTQQIESSTKGAYAWNQAIRSETEASRLFNYNAAQAEELRKLGFAYVHSSSGDGIARGKGMVVSLSDEKENTCIVLGNASFNQSFDKGSSTQDYPTSLMGSIALLRQTFLDAEWYKSTGYKEQKNISLEAWNAAANLPFFFEANDKYNVLRADKIGDEFNKSFIIKAGGNEYQIAKAIKGSKCSLIAGLQFPATPDVEDPNEAEFLSNAELLHWEQAPTNLSVLEKEKINFCISAYDLKSKSDFFSNLRKAIKCGLSDTTALKALTETPAQILQVQDMMGSLSKGKQASFFIANNNIFQDKSYVLENWIQGKRFIIKNEEINLAKASFDLQGVLNAKCKLEISSVGSSVKSVLSLDTNKLSSTIKINKENIFINFSYHKKLFQLNGVITKNEANEITFMRGFFVDSMGVEKQWLANKLNELVVDKTEKKDSTQSNAIEPKIIYPFSAYGYAALPTAQKILVKNTTVWTNEAEGILPQTDVLIEGGKIKQVAKNIVAKDALLIDGSNKHLTAGIIDEHSHIGISGSVNESSQSSTAEVRIGDVINADDINIYRQLSGGVTAAQLLHGSANAIGGQSALIKLRWGMLPEEMKIEGAAGFIKFALGENVKQSNWGNISTTRFPQTRMGVEQVYYDAFTRAREYDLLKAANKNYRKDLDLEALSEIINKKRFITCHSYLQSEINMLMHVADSFHFKVNTFTHILEGYKVADKMKLHGVGASTFADWWAYKFEVMEAVPHNAALMTKMGITVAINSDDAEMGRRLNQESAKAMKYGGLSEEEAMKLCTLNPAKLLHLDQQMGSIKVGKDADVVLWTDHPLSIYAKAEKTIVDGKILYDLQSNEQLQQAQRAERQRILAKMLDAKKSGAATEKPKAKIPKIMHCDD